MNKIFEFKDFNGKNKKISISFDSFSIYKSNE